jgi:hypothetical protein
MDELQMRDWIEDWLSDNIDRVVRTSTAFVDLEEQVEKLECQLDAQDDGHDRQIDELEDRIRELEAALAKQEMDRDYEEIRERYASKERRTFLKRKTLVRDFLELLERSSDEEEEKIKST